MPKKGKWAVAACMWAWIAELVLKYCGEVLIFPLWATATDTIGVYETSACVWTCAQRPWHAQIAKKHQRKLWAHGLPKLNWRGEIEELSDERCRGPQWEGWRTLMHFVFLPPQTWLLAAPAIQLKVWQIWQVLKIMKADLTKNFESYGRPLLTALWDSLGIWMYLMGFDGIWIYSLMLDVPKAELAFFYPCRCFAHSEWIPMLSCIGLVPTCRPQVSPAMHWRRLPSSCLGDIRAHKNAGWSLAHLAVACSSMQ